MWEGCSTQGQWQLSFLPSLCRHTPQLIPVLLWCSLSCCPFTRVEPKVTAYEWDFVHWSFKKTSGFPAAFCFTWKDGISTDFHSQMLFGLLFLIPVVAWGAWCGAETTPRGTLAAEMALLILNCYRWVWDHPSSPLLSVSAGSFLYTLNYKTYFN